MDQLWVSTTLTSKSIVIRVNHRPRITTYVVFKKQKGVFYQGQYKTGSFLNGLKTSDIDQLIAALGVNLV